MKSNRFNLTLESINLKTILPVISGIIVLAIFQDYLFSFFKNTGFYFSESLLYNMLWLFFIPFLWIIKEKTVFIRQLNKRLQLTTILLSGTLFSIIHLFLFALFFVLISNIVFDPPHRFMSIFSTALSNQFFILFIVYVGFPYFAQRKKSKINQTTSYPEQLKIKHNQKHIIIDVLSIQLLSTDRPYTLICTEEKEFLHSESLKKLEQLLDPNIFIRVHRSAIINKQYVRSISSRKNGDYDAQLNNGQSVRLSRHYRSNWSCLLH